MTDASFRKFCKDSVFLFFEKVYLVHVILEITIIQVQARYRKNYNKIPA